MKKGRFDNLIEPFLCLGIVWTLDKRKKTGDVKFSLKLDLACDFLLLFEVLCVSWSLSKQSVVETLKELTQNGGAEIVGKNANRLCVCVLIEKDGSILSRQAEKQSRSKFGFVLTLSLLDQDRELHIIVIKPSNHRQNESDQRLEGREKKS